MSRRDFLQALFILIAAFISAPFEFLRSKKPKFETYKSFGREMVIVEEKEINRIIEGEEVLYPTFEIACNPQIKLSDIKARRFHIVDRKNIVTGEECKPNIEIEKHKPGRIANILECC